MISMKYLIIAVMIVLSIFIVGCTKNVQTNNNVPSNNVQTSADVQTTNSKIVISLSELETHNKESDCWIAYEGNVYDITYYLSIHSDTILDIAWSCGTAGKFESAFTQMYGLSEVANLQKQATYKGKLE
jgi:hypothetical protein